MDVCKSSNGKLGISNVDAQLFMRQNANAGGGACMHLNGPHTCITSACRLSGNTRRLYS